MCYFACDLGFLCLHRQGKDRQRGTDGALCRMIPQQTLFEWLFNVKCDKCLEWGWGLDRGREKQEFVSATCALHINQEKSAVEPRVHT